MKPIEVNKRIDILDYLRGFALGGIIFVNILALLSVKTPAPYSVDAAYQRFLFLFVEGRLYTIFSFLFGVGFYLFFSRANEKGAMMVLRRMLVLFIFGIIHVRFHPGEALTVYAVCGLILFPFYKAPKTVNLVVGLLMLIALSIFSIKIFLPIPLMLLGIAAGQYRIFDEIRDKTKKITIFTIILLVGSILCLIYQFQFVPSMPFDIREEKAFMKIGITIGPIISGLYGGVLIILLQIPFVQKGLSPLKNYGRMALTNYLSQTAFMLFARSIFTQITYIHSFFLCIAIIMIQLMISTIWLRFFKFGPLEWVWRIITYLEVPPLKQR
jgi:uncharacterized membrane protein YeiB